jgi:hypothetical protein
MTWLLGKVTGALAGAWGYIAAAGGMILAVLVVLFQAKKAGKNEVIVETQKREIEDAATAKEVERDIALAKPDDVRERLRKYTRD